MKCVHKFGNAIRNVCVRCGWDALSEVPDPNGSDTFSDRAEDALRALNDLSDDERFDVIKRYCTSCGSKNPRCQCSNDE